NTLNLTQNTINSILEKTENLNYEIILVDNDSKDGSKEFFKNEYKNREKIKFIESDLNLGFGRANNLGLKYATGEYIFFLNSDTLLVDNSIKILFDFMEKNEEVGVCGANLYDENMNPVHSYDKEIPGIFYDLRSFFRNIYTKISKKRLDFNYSEKTIEVGYITGADMFVRKKVLDEVGGFDSDFFMYYEESELTYRIKKAGYKIMNIPQARIIHLEGKSFEFKETRFRMATESKYKYFNKVYGKREAGLSYFISQIKYSFLVILGDKKKFLLNREEYKKFKNNF
ncbi:MAG: glycosyltransferase family 2 protein, partial [Fusobacteriaceae bacterium]